MINLAVVEIKDVMKYLVKLTIVITIVMLLTRYFLGFRTKKIDTSSIVGEYTFLSCLDIVVPNIEEVNKKEETINTNLNNPQKLLKMPLEIELGMMENLSKEDSKNENQETPQEEINEKKEEEKLEEAKTGLTTQVQESNVPQKYTTTYKTVKIKNETDIKLTEEMLNPDVKINMDNILIYHTHSCESYTQTEKYTYKASGNFRTTNKERSVIRVGKELEKYMKNYGCTVIHDQTLYDYPAYNGSYDRSLKNVGELLDKNEGTEVVFDIHRDAIRRQ